MKKSILILFLSICCSQVIFAKHIIGGEMIYESISSNSTSRTYRITLILFKDSIANCTNCAAMPASVLIGIFNNDNSSLVNSFTIPRDSLRGPLETDANMPTCIINAPTFNYYAGFYSVIITLPNNGNGYTAAYQTCCRISNINNIQNVSTGANGEGATYSTNIPGNNQLGNSLMDNSPKFSRVISVVCFDNNFSLDFSAKDKDNDSLVYYFCGGFNGGLATDANPIIPSTPPYNNLTYQTTFSGNTPLGAAVTINSRTGFISGIAPAPGKYVVSVCVSSYRNGQYISTHRKDFIITVASCNFASASLNPEYITCDGLSYSFNNLSNSPLNLTFFWDFGDPNSLSNNTSTLVAPSHTFSDTGVYRVKLIVNKDDPACADSTETIIRVFPGFIPGFNYPTSMCKAVPINFSDNTYAAYGAPSLWHWDFGLNSSTSDTSNLSNPIFSYQDTGIYLVKLLVTSNKGCFDSIALPIHIVDRPSITVTNDTIICKIDGLQLNASSSIPNGIFTWSPNVFINNQNISNPFVSPIVNTTYYVNFLLNNNYPNCSKKDSVKVRVIDTVTLFTIKDTIICRNDSVRLITLGTALQFTWSPANSLNNAFINSPLATPTSPSTLYTVKGNIGSCYTTKSLTVTTIPYPTAYAGADTTICRGSSAYLHASGGIKYTWDPTLFLNFSTVSNPISISPIGDYIDYIVYVYDTMGCPKPSKDTVRVNIENISIDAGTQDTSIVSGQQLQLNSTVYGALSSVIYNWSPNTIWLNATNIPNPIANTQGDITYYVNVKSSIGCTNKDSINVNYYTVLPDFFVPNAFTPNNDGLNDIITPLALGLKSIESFKIYNRWGELMFYTAELGKGWDGTFKGKPQDIGTYVWQANGIDYKNIHLKRKGTVILIR